MQISLSGDLERFVEQKVSEGDYASPSEVVCDALALLKEQSELDPEKIAELRREIMIGDEQIERGECGEWNVEKIKAEARRRSEFKRGCS